MSAPMPAFPSMPAHLLPHAHAHAHAVASAAGSGVQAVKMPPSSSSSTRPLKAGRDRLTKKARISSDTIDGLRRATNNRVLAPRPDEEEDEELSDVEFATSAATLSASSTPLAHGVCQLALDPPSSSSLVGVAPTSSQSSKRSYSEYSTPCVESSVAAIAVDHLPSPQVDLISPAPTTATSCMDQLEIEECEESLDELGDFTSPEAEHAPADESMLPAEADDPELAVHASSVISFDVRPSSFRTYRGKESLIVSVETVLDDLNPELERHMWDSEQQFQPYMFYLVYQSYLDPTMRPVLVDWMFEVGAEYCLARETVGLAINYVDRFLGASPSDLPADGTAQSVIDRQSLQLLGVTCLWIASKVEEIDPPTPEDFAITTDNAYSARQVVAMEPVILRVLQWRLHAQTPYSFLKLFLKKAAVLLHGEFKRRVQQLPTAPANSAAHHDAINQFALLQHDFLNELDYLLSTVWFVRMMEMIDVLALDMHSLRFYPSQIAAAALFLVHPPGSPLYDLVTLATTYQCAQLQPCIQLLGLFMEMRYCGPPAESRHSFMLDFKIPYDEFHSRQVHNADALPILKAAFELIASGSKPTASSVATLAAANIEAARVAAEAGLPPPAPAPLSPTDSVSLEAISHTNIFRNLPVFLSGAVWPELLMRQLVKPIRNTDTHLLPGMWESDPNARHDDHTTHGPLGLVEPTELELLLGAETAAALKAAITSAKVPLAASAPVAPASDSFLAAASKPFARMPKDAVRAGDRAAAAAATAALASSSSTTIYTFGGGSSLAPSAAAARAPRVRTGTTADEWLTSDEDEA